MKQKLSYFAVSALLFLALGVFLERPLYAYADPGSSLLLFQSISAFVTGALFYFRRRIRAFMTRSESDSSQDRSN